MLFIMIIMFTMIITGYQYVTILHHFIQVAQVGENKDRTIGALFWATRGLSDSLYIYTINRKTWKWFPRVWRYVWITHTIPYLWFTETSASEETISINQQKETIVETISLTINQYYQYRRPRFCNLCTVRVETQVLRCWTRLPGVRDPSKSPAQGKGFIPSCFLWIL